MKTKNFGYLIELLQSEEWIGTGKNIEIAKGKYKLPKDWNEYIKLLWRSLKQ